ncbi:RNI-like protein [Dothidotthia symphoricarpi CBS 119687]|uniref:RNI-like protein n=1 Tax=Dothidotthia symphoricarpi CBS 119687 TaxID=1392245 RepID=A0A6A6A701_9PLEO|nr:RNI-like protein [Dothidotthia symphoricarpi CBS 119687]KAF2126913.1 RNI-like protein [Dothidotthia symphoricarpi CBS 119687]
MAVPASHEPQAAMEDIHGVDVSWLHHSSKDHHHHRQQAPSSPGLNGDVRPRTSSRSGLPARPLFAEKAAPEPAPAVKPPSPPPPATVAAPPATSPPHKGHIKRPSLLSRTSSEKVPTPAAATGSRRNSWMSSISSKFSSQNPPAQTTHAQAQGAPASTQGANPTTPSANGALNGIHSAAGGSHHFGAFVPQSPKSNFLSSALRRLSSGTQVASSSQVLTNGGICPRRVLNVDPNRTRCHVPELDQNKLRKVAFCVDVEIACGPKYAKDADPDEKRQRDDNKLKERGEGEALKNPHSVAQEKDTNGVVNVSQEAVGNESSPNPEGTILHEDGSETNKKKEKKKRSEAERKERKEKKRRKAEENGTIPMELTRDDDDSSVDVAPAEPRTAAPKVQVRPTIDPLRIYRRCCQLRESPILKRISDQLSNPSACSAGEVNLLDLTGSRLQLADIVTLSDWLAIVPVKKLFLEDADLTDEKIRVVLAGLLAAKDPQSPRKSVSMEARDGKRQTMGNQDGCAIKKLVLKNNPKITSEGWKHITLFIYMCRSILALDVSMIPFPKPQPQTTPAPSNGEQGSADTAESHPRDLAEVMCRSISQRVAGSRLEELVMAECALTSSTVKSILEGCINTGIKRVGLAGNDLDSEGLEHVLNYIKSGICEGIDLGGNDLRQWIQQLCDNLPKNSPLWALCLQDTGMTPDSLKILFPKLVSLPVFRFLDLSHNKGLFSHQTSLCLLRKYMPQLRELKRIHLVDVDLKPADAIAIAEIIPDCPHIAHLNILENPEISRVARSEDEETQEEAAALYASLTLAAKISRSLVCVDVDVPTPEMGEVVRALAKQVVAYCLRNIESINLYPELPAVPKDVEIPDILMHLVGEKDDYVKTPASDNDYIVGGTGIAKALSYCLSQKDTDYRRVSVPTSGANTPRSRTELNSEAPSRARTMSKTLLDTARNTRARIQPTLHREAQGGDVIAYRRLLFLDQTLEGMIQRFEDEYPETRIPHSDSASTHSVSSVLSSSPPASTVATLSNSVNLYPESDEDEPHLLRSRHNSDVSLASRNMALEEGRLHRFGHRVRTNILNSSRPSSPSPSSLPGGRSPAPPPENSTEGVPEHLHAMREYFSNLSGEELTQMTEGVGWDKAFEKLVQNVGELRELERHEDPVSFKRFMDSQIAALRNRNPDICPEEPRGSARGDEVAVED